LFVHFSGRCLRLKSKKQVPNDIHQSFPQNFAERKCEAMLSAPCLGGWLSGADRLLQRKLALKKVHGHMAGETRARAEAHALMCLEPVNCHRFLHSDLGKNCSREEKDRKGTSPSTAFATRCPFWLQHVDCRQSSDGIGCAELSRDRRGLAMPGAAFGSSLRAELVLNLRGNFPQIANLSDFRFHLLHTNQLFYCFILWLNFVQSAKVLASPWPLLQGFAT